ncbi:MAG: PD-(D/E)XK nuclease-like domain-containing protein [Parcubacteria group bacterium]
MTITNQEGGDLKILSEYIDSQCMRMEIKQGYFDYPALGSSLLADFAECPAKALLQRTPTPAMEFGHIFEWLAQETFTQKPCGFFDKYFICDAVGTIPEKLVLALTNNQPLEELYVLTQKGARSETYKNLHFWLDECQNSPGKWPISQTEFKTASDMVDHLGNASAFQGVPVKSLLYDADWQVEHFWERGGVKKKCKFDAVATLDDESLAIVDLKSLASINKFWADYRARYWLQDRHYSEGAADKYGGDAFYQDAMIFAVVSKEEPYIGQCFEMSHQFWPAQTEAYLKICNRYQNWVDSGMPATAWRDKQIMENWRG